MFPFCLPENYVFRGRSKETFGRNGFIPGNLSSQDICMIQKTYRKILRDKVSTKVSIEKVSTINTHLLFSKPHIHINFMKIVQDEFSK